MEQGKESAFKVTDKRSAFHEHPSESSEPDATSGSQEPVVEPERATEHPPRHEHAEDSDSSAQRMEADFMSLIFSFYTYGQISMGILPDPVTQQPQKDLMQAQYHIDMLGVLQEKTRKNLTQEEERALEQMLYELRMAYVQVSKA